MKQTGFIILGLCAAWLLVACASVDIEKPAGLYNRELAVTAFQKGGCPACHVIPGIPGSEGTIGPDLSTIGSLANERIAAPDYKGKAKSPVGYLHESILSPDLYIPADCPNGPCTKGVMPASLANTLSKDEMATIVGYLAGLPDSAQADGAENTTDAPLGPAPKMTEEEFTWAKKTFFERCAGCHGTLRKGATGPALTPDKTIPKGTAGLAAIIFNGTPRGMPDWGKQGFFTQEQTDSMAKYLQNDPPTPPDPSGSK